MNWFTGIVLYTLIWWIVLFAVLPIGTHPVELLGAGFKAPLGTDEMAIAGGIRGQAVKLAAGDTVDVPYVADAEIVLEGEVLPTGWTAERSEVHGRAVGRAALGHRARVAVGTASSSIPSLLPQISSPASAARSPESLTMAATANICSPPPAVSR